MSNRTLRRIAFLALAPLAIACKGGGDAGQADTTPAATATPAAPAAGAEQTPDAGGQVIVVKMITDATSNRFEPANFEAKQGDVIRYTLETGVHNVHFVADSNKTATGLPAAPSDMLQLPGQTYDVKVTWGPGSYYYQCDPHALLGMVGRITVK